jgi:hypothetical protein
VMIAERTTGCAAILRFITQLRRRPVGPTCSIADLSSSLTPPATGSTSRYIHITRPGRDGTERAARRAAIRLWSVRLRRSRGPAQ